MIECFVEAFVIFEFTDFDGRTNDHLGAVRREDCAQLVGLRSRARDNDRDSFQRFGHCKRVLAACSIKVAAREAPSASAVSGGPDKESWRRLDPSGLATRPSNFSNSPSKRACAAMGN